MKLDDLSFKLLGKEIRPLVVGGMGVDISTSELALVAARHGGVGHISDAMSPYLSDRKFRTRFQSDKREKYKHYEGTLDKKGLVWDPEAVYQAQCNHVRSTMERKRGDGLVFVNVMEKLTMGAPKETLRARLRGALDSGIDGITLSAGLHTGTLKLMEDNPRFRDAAIGIIVSSARALKLFLRSAARSNRMPDYIVVEGPLAGGHLGFGLDWKNYDLKTIIGEVCQLLRDEGLKIPIVAAGGVFSGADAISMIAHGASAVQVATRFVISRECGLPTDVKQKYIRAEESDIEVNMTSPTGYPMRMLKFSPSMTSNIKPNCEALGYILDAEGRCGYHDAYASTGFDANNKKLPVTEKMCICYHFMKMQCYTCGHNAYRLKHTTTQLADGKFYLPPAEEIFFDYLTNLQATALEPAVVEVEPSALGASAP